MKRMEQFFQKNLLRRDFIRWLMKLTTSTGLFAIFGGGLFKKTKAHATQAAKASGVSTAEGSLTLPASSAQRILLKDGLIVDGTGGKAFKGSILINGHKIEKVIGENVSFEGSIIDCSGRVIAPGIIDMHSHLDWVLPATGRHDLTTPFTRQGITTFIGGNCGFGVAGFKKGSHKTNAESSNADFYKTVHRRVNGLYDLQWDTMAGYFNYLKKQGITHNLATLAGNGTTRASIQGFDPTPMTGDRMKQQMVLLEEALEQGARGVSFGLQYEPDVFVTLDEFKQVADLVKRKDKIITVHMKAYSALSGTYPLKFFGTPHNLIAIKEMLDMARDTGVRIQLSHLIFVGERTWKSYEKAFELIDRAIQDGVDVKFDTYAYHCGVSHINVVLPEWFLARIPEVFKSRWALLKLRGELTLIKNLLGFGYEDIQITKANHPDLEPYNGMFLKDIARKRDMGGFENFIDFVQKSNGIAAVLNHRYSNKAQVKAMIQHPASLFQTDATVHLAGVQNPAAYGNFPRILQYARDFDLLGLEAVIHKMTGASADRFGIKDRGILADNKAADIMVFDWLKVKDNNTDTQTSETPSGIDYVFINGVPALNRGKIDTRAQPGAVL
jgi:N-acyl-D-aspartate/D-glutamate deacylase